MFCFICLLLDVIVPEVRVKGKKKGEKKHWKKNNTHRLLDFFMIFFKVGRDILESFIPHFPRIFGYTVKDFIVKVF